MTDLIILSVTDGSAGEVCFLCYAEREEFSEVPIWAVGEDTNTMRPLCDRHKNELVRWYEERRG